MNPRVRAALDEVLPGLGGAGPLTDEDRKRQRIAEGCEGRGIGRAVPARGVRGAKACAQHAWDVGLLADRRAAELVDLARQFLVQKRGCGKRRRFQISREEGEALWDGWAGSLEGIERREGGQRACSVGKVLYAIERRAIGVSSGVDGVALADAEAKIGAEFCEFDKLPRVRFECSMLQTAVEGADGAVTWRDVQCGVHDGSKW